MNDFFTQKSTIMKRILMLTILGMISLTTQLQAQKINEKIELDNDIYIKKYPFMVGKGDKLIFNIKSMVKDGSLNLKIYNPKKELYNTMSLEGSIGQSGMSSTFVEDVDDPIAGEWVLELENRRAQGKVKMKIKVK